MVPKSHIYKARLQKDCCTSTQNFSFSILNQDCFMNKNWWQNVVLYSLVRLSLCSKALFPLWHLPPPESIFSLPWENLSPHIGPFDDLWWHHLQPLVEPSAISCGTITTLCETILHLQWRHLLSLVWLSVISLDAIWCLSCLYATSLGTLCHLRWDCYLPFDPLPSAPMGPSLTSQEIIYCFPCDHLPTPIGSAVTFQGVIFHLPLHHLSPPMDATASSVGIISKFSWAHLLSPMDSPVSSHGPTCYPPLAHLSLPMDPSTPFHYSICMSYGNIVPFPWEHLLSSIGSSVTSHGTICCLPWDHYCWHTKEYSQ